MKSESYAMNSDDPLILSELELPSNPKMPKEYLTKTLILYNFVSENVIMWVLCILILVDLKKKFNSKWDFLHCCIWCAGLGCILVYFNDWVSLTELQSHLGHVHSYLKVWLSWTIKTANSHDWHFMLVAGLQLSWGCQREPPCNLSVMCISQVAEFPT